MNFLMLPVGTVVKIKNKQEVEKEYGSGFPVVERYGGEYVRIEVVSNETGCYYTDAIPFGLDDRMITKVENPIGIYLVEADDTVITKKYCAKEDEKAKESIIESLQFDLNEYTKIIVEEL